MMDFSKFKKLTINGVELKQLFINGIQVWKAGYKNWVKFSTEADGVTIYNGGLGYRNGYRVRSGGAEAELSDAGCTGFIPVKSGDVIRMSGWKFTAKVSHNAVNVYDSGFNNIGQTAGNGDYGIMSSYTDYLWDSFGYETSDVWKWIVPPADSGIAYIRVTGCVYGKGEDMIVTVNEEIA